MVVSRPRQRVVATKIPQSENSKELMVFQRPQKTSKVSFLPFTIFYTLLLQFDW